MTESKQGISTFDLSVNDGNFNVTIDGIVGEGAYIALHDKDVTPEFDNYLVSYGMDDFVDCETIDATAKFPVMKASGTNWINYNAASEMTIVIWDSTPEHTTTDAQFVCRIPSDIKGTVQSDFPPPPTDPGERGHSQYLGTFRAFLNNSDWNLAIEGVFSSKAWVGLYQDVDSPGQKNSTKYDYIGNFQPTPTVTHPERPTGLVHLDGSNWFNIRAKTDCRWVIWDITFPTDYAVGDRFILHIPEFIEVVPDRNYD